MTPDEFLRQYESATRDHDLDATMSMIDRNAVYWFSTGTSHTGHAEIREAIAHNFETIEQEHYRISDIRWLLQTNHCASCTYRFEWSGKIQGQELSGSGRGTSILRKSDGEWKIIHEHLSKPAH